MTARRFMYLQSRIGRRMVGLFVLCALLPLSVATIFLATQFNDRLIRNQEQDLASTARGYGHTLLGRLGSADDVLQALIEARGATDGSVQRQVSGLPWAAGARISVTDRASRDTERSDPVLDSRQRLQLERGHSTISLTTDERGTAQIHLVRGLPSGARLDVQLQSEWLWADAADYARDAHLLVVDERNATLTLVAPAGDSNPLAAPAAGNAALNDDRWLNRSWEVFLGSRYSSPSWRVIAMQPRPALLSLGTHVELVFPAIILLTIFLVSVLSVAAIRRQVRPLEQLNEATQKVSRRDFTGRVDTGADDEFGDLARSFNSMSGQLQQQFTALETLAQIDRLLLRAPDLERILDALLPRVAAVLGCQCASVLLIDRDAPERSRVYDWFTDGAEKLSVRRVACHLPALAAMQGERAFLEVADAEAGKIAWLRPLVATAVKAIRLHPLRHDGELSGYLCVGRTAAGEPAGAPVISASDVADRLSLILANVERSEKLYQQAHFDGLTGLPNRQLFCDRFDAALQATLQANALGALLYIDLDYFKRVNDSAGHAAGDELLRCVAKRLTACIKDGDSVARLAGDEFAVLLPHMDDPSLAGMVAARMLASLQEPIVINGREHHVNASIGVTIFPADGRTIEDLLKSSDIAMYRAKESGRGRVVFFEVQMQQRMLERMALEVGLHRAMERNEFELHYQPIVGRGAQPSIGAEALVRWPTAPQGDGRSPALFVAVAEETGMIVALGEWVLRTACRDLVAWRQAGVPVDYVSVNLSARQLREGNLPDRISAILADCGLPATQLQLEITESVLADGLAVERQLAAIAASGVRLALDDFGTGYSSLSYLRTYPIRAVKIDRTFINGVPGDVASCRLVESIIAMCRALGKQVIAEGVETESQLRFLDAAQCTAIQGYLLGRPMDAADISGFARRLHAGQLPGWPQQVIPQAAGIRSVAT